MKNKIIKNKKHGHRFLKGNKVIWELPPIPDGVDKIVVVAYNPGNNTITSYIFNSKSSFPEFIIQNGKIQNGKYYRNLKKL